MGLTYECEAYDTDLRAVRCRFYTTGKKRADRWANLPRIQFTDSGHGIVFSAKAHTGKRKGTIGDPSRYEQRG